WDAASTYIRKPLLFDEFTVQPPPLGDLTGARPLAILGDSITTDHISPVGAIPAKSPAGKYLQELGVPQMEFNTYSARRVHYEVLIRGTFSNRYLKNEMLPGTTGGVTRHVPSGREMSIYDAAMLYKQE